MSFTLRGNIALTIFGESHGILVGGTMDGLPAGLKIDRGLMKEWMERRRPGQSFLTTQRKEEDSVEIVSGVDDSYTTGGPVTVLIRNRDTIPDHYEEIKDKPRPGHGDLTMLYKYGIHRPYSGGGFISGRMTAPLVALGSITLEMLHRNGVVIGSYIDTMGPIQLNESFNLNESAYSYPSRIPDKTKDLEAQQLIKRLLGEGNSVGATIRTVVDGIPEGIGDPFFDSVESKISHAMFSIPGLKGIEFGSGFHFSSMKGSEANDPFTFRGNKIVTTTNHNGGVLGGITNGMPLVFRIVMKPTSSIKIPQKTVNLATMKDDEISVTGRHDPCIAIRAVPVVQTLTSVVLADLMKGAGFDFR
jgi:chorismate synthase